jgi:hypothetical protein
MIMTLYAIIPIALVYFFIIIPEYKEYKLLKSILIKLQKIKDTNAVSIRRPYYTITAKNRLLRSIIDILNDLLEHKNLITRSFHPLTIFDFKRTSTTYHKINRDVDTLISRSGAINFKKSRLTHNRFIIYNYRILEEINTKLDKIV